MPGIYKITSPSNSVYIGQTTVSFKKRWEYYFKLKCIKQPKLFASLKKHGPENHTFEIIEEFTSELQVQLIDAYEEAIFCEYEAAGFNMLNTRRPGLQPKHSPETIEKLRIANTGKKSKPESIAKGIATRIKNGSTGKGVPKSDEVKAKISNTLTGRKIPADVIRKREETMKRLNRRESRKGIKCKRVAPGRQVDQYTKDGVFVKSFKSIVLAAKENGILSTSINNNIKGRTQSAGGYVFKNKT